MNPIIVIPARMGSSRLPNKPLADICGKPLILHVVDRAIEAHVGEIAVATDSVEVADVVHSYGIRSVLTRVDHASGTDRIMEALRLLDPEERFDAVVNLQGDLPTVKPDTVAAVVTCLTDKVVDISTAVARITSDHELIAPSVVKMIGTEIAARRHRALYFTRQPPYGDGPNYHHIGLYGYRRAALERFVSLPPSRLELRESLEQLRGLEAGMRIDAAEVDEIPLGVDTQDDLERARMIFEMEM